MTSNKSNKLFSQEVFDVIVASLVSMHIVNDRAL